MKNLILTFLLIYNVNSFACKCESTNLDTSFLTSSFVAKIKVIKKYKNLEEDDYYKIDIKILDLYKGNQIGSIYIYGNSEYPQDSACWIYTDVDDEIIVYVSKYENGRTEVRHCSRILILDNEKYYKFERSYSKKERFDDESKILGVLKNYNIKYSNNGKIIFNVSCFLHLLNVDLLNNKLSKPKNRLAIYEFTLGNDYDIKKVKTLKGFNKKIDRKIKKIIKQQKWTKDFGKKNNLKKGIKSFVIIYYLKRYDGKNYLRAKSM